MVCLCVLPSGWLLYGFNTLFAGSVRQFYIHLVIQKNKQAHFLFGLTDLSALKMVFELGTPKPAVESSLLRKLLNCSWGNKQNQPAGNMWNVV